MTQIVLAGVGGQGILTIAKLLSSAAAKAGFNVKQAEVHGMSQRGGAVHAHVRLSRSPLHTERILPGTADLILATEPLEAMRQMPYLRDGGAVVSGTSPVTNCPDYPPVERLLDGIAQCENHVLLDLNKLARAAGSARAANMVALGAASWLLPIRASDLEQEIVEAFQVRGEAAVLSNVRAFRFGRNAASLYREAVRRGVQRRSILQWIDTLDPSLLAEDEPGEGLVPTDWTIDPNVLSGAEVHAFEQALVAAHRQGRRRLLEHEVYALVELVGAISPPVHRFVAANDTLSPQDLDRFPGDRLVLKLVSESVVHKSEAGGVVFVDKHPDAVRQAVNRLMAVDPGAYGVLAVEYVEPEYRGFGSELFVGIRATREFGPVIAAGLGGVETEYLASRMIRGAAVTHAVATEVDADGFLELFRQTAAYDVLAGNIRGHRRLVSDAELLRLFRAFIAIARHFCVDRGEAAPDIGELEVNPFAFRNHRLVPLDGRGLMRTAPPRRRERPRDKVRKLIEPRTIAVLGVSSQSMNYGRIILNNIARRRPGAAGLYVVKPGAETIDGVPCVPSVADLPKPTDLLVVASPAGSLSGILDECLESGKVEAGILIPGGVGEAEGSEEIGRRTEEALARCREEQGPVFVGPNCMGVLSRIGRYDTFFIPEARLPLDWETEPTGLGIVSQSGAFVVGRLSKLPHLRPVAAVSIGNQMDVTVADALHVLAERPEVRTLAAYVEGFANYDGLDFLQAVRHARANGKSVVFYKAGRTDAGRTAAAGHTASLAGDYDVAVSAASRAGALVAESFAEFEMLLETATFLDSRRVTGDATFAITNAGMEAVAIADQATADSGFQLASFSEDARRELSDLLADLGLKGLATPNNPLDLTPMGDERAYDALVRWALSRPDVHAAIVACVPLAPNLRTTADALGHPQSLVSLAQDWLRDTDKPFVFVVDAGAEFEPLVRALRSMAVPVFRSADSAASILGRYLQNRLHAGHS